MLETLVAWAAAHRTPLQWGAPAGPQRLTPLHLAAALPDSGALAQAALLRSPGEATLLWFAAEAAGGGTPAQFARLAGAGAANRLAARRLRALAASAREPAGQQPAPAAEAAPEEQRAPAAAPQQGSATGQRAALAQAQPIRPAPEQAAEAGASCSALAAPKPTPSGSNRPAAVAPPSQASGAGLICYWLTASAVLLAAAQLCAPSAGWLLLPLSPLVALVAVLVPHLLRARSEPPQLSALRRLLGLLVLQQDAEAERAAEACSQQSLRAEAALQGLALVLGPMLLLLWEAGGWALGSPGPLLRQLHGPASRAAAPPPSAVREILAAAAANVGGLVGAAASAAAASSQRGAAAGLSELLLPALAAAAAAMAALAAAGARSMLSALCLCGCATAMAFGALAGAAQPWFARNRGPALALLQMALLLASKASVLALPAVGRQVVENTLLLVMLLLGGSGRHWKMLLLLWDAATSMLLVTAAGAGAAQLAGPGQVLLLDTAAIKAAVSSTVFCLMFCQHLLSAGSDEEEAPAAGGKVKEA
jgi:hypothetical protein